MKKQKGYDYIPILSEINTKCEENLIPISIKFLGLAIDIIYKIEGFSHIEFQPVNFKVN